MALIEEKERLDEDYQSEYDFVKQKYLDQGIAPALATQATNELMPMVAVMITPAATRIWATVVAVLIALCITGYAAAVLGDAERGKSVVRNVVAGLLTMAVTFVIGQLFAR